MARQMQPSTQAGQIGSIATYEKPEFRSIEIPNADTALRSVRNNPFHSAKIYRPTRKKEEQEQNSNPMSSVTREEIAAQLAAAKAERSVDIAAIHLDMEKLRSETALALEKLRGDNLTAFAEMRGDMRSNSEALRADFHQMVTAITKESSRVAEGIAEVRGSVDGLKSSITMLQWVLATVAALAAAWIGYQQLEVAKQTPAAPAVVASPSTTPATTASKP